MHMGGLLAGLVIGGMLFSKKHPDAHGVLRYRESQRKLVFLSAVLFAVLCILTVAFAASPDTQQFFRSCSLCRFINCVEPTFITVKQYKYSDLLYLITVVHRGLQPQPQPQPRPRPRP